MYTTKKIALAVSVSLVASMAMAAPDAAQSTLDTRSAVGEITNRVEEAVKTGDLSALSPKATDSNSTKKNIKTTDLSGSKAYPEVPARYLRPDATKTEQKQAAKDLKKAADTTAQVKTEASQHEYSKVSINTGSVIDMKPGGNVFIPISREHPNRLLTPFQNPQIISTTLSGGRKAGECGEICVRSGVIYITTDSPSAVTAFITEKGHEDIAFSVTMVPQAIPPREVRFTLPESIVEELRRNKSGSVGMKRAQAWEMTQPYVETLKIAMRSVALGQVPDGYTLRDVKAKDKVPACEHQGLKIDFRNGQIMEGYNLDIFAGVITNVSDRPVEFRNQNCGNWNNAAVTSWPLTVLRPGQKTEIYIAVKKHDEIPNEMVRKPLIEREFN